MGLPRIVPVSKLKIFKFYENGSITEAVVHENVVLKLAKIVPIEHSKDAYGFAHDLSQNHVTVMSPGGDFYRVWVDIRCSVDFKLSFNLTNQK